MPDSTQVHGQETTDDTSVVDTASDVEIIEIGDSPVKRAGPPKSSHQQRKPFAIDKAEKQMAPMFSQMAASTSTSTSTPLKRKRNAHEESASSTPTAFDKSIHTASSAQPSTVSKAARLDPLKANSVVGPGSLLGSLLDNVTKEGSAVEKKGQSAQRMSHEVSSSLGSMIFWGPPGSGKTTLARLLASKIEADFKELSATSSGAADVRKVFDQAKNQLRLTGRSSIQDQGKRPACRLTARSTHSSVFTLEKHSVAELEQILRNAVSALPPPVPRIPSTLIPFLADVSDGDARQALNSLELALSVCKKREAEDKQNAVKDTGDEEMSAKPEVSDAQDSEETDEDRMLMTAIKQGLRKGYDRTGETRYDMISAMHKSIRGSDGSAALYWLARMLEGGEDAVYIARRLIVFASEDVGLADPQALPLVRSQPQTDVQIAMACYQACQVIGLPECRINLAHCVAYLSEANKSTRSYEAYKKAVALANETPLPGVPLQIRNAPTNLMKQLGYGKDYSYNPDFAHPVHNEYLPATLAESSTFGIDSLLHTEEQYRNRVGKEWDESRLRDWELMRNKGQDWEGRNGR
ncbi:hypothetical protein QFC22_005482 [Naganishia vaughanmartiniae]|uniref:Uncharacterized protein n=1 Tax=Naganishia vaughanmartiniae TaxID=1424756 RepID=A0ACC2WS46_9TREE|nr:hypothetical protein QFC22_005482 [Naganishia vaughanmartiniae]